MDTEKIDSAAGDCVATRTDVTAATFLKTLFECQEGFVEIRQLGNGIPLQDFCPLPLKSLPRFHKDTHDIYFGVAPRHREDGHADAIVSTPTLWLDVDGKAFPRGKAEALAKLNKLDSFRPNIIVDSGNGFHAYWLLDKPVPIVDAQGIMQALKHAVSDALDNVSDAPRILRVPGTLNHKNGTRLPVKVVLWEPQRRFSPDDLWKHLDIGTAEEQIQGAATRKAASRADGIILEGQRNRALTSLAGTLRHRGMSGDAIEAALAKENEARCAPPLPEAEVIGIARSVARYRPGAKEEAMPGYEFTDLRNAQRLVERRGKDLHFCFPLGVWMVWDSRHWSRDNKGKVQAWAKDAARSIYGEARGAGSDTYAGELAKWAKVSASEGRVRAMVGMARTEPGIPLIPEELDADRWL
ncbi:MAG: primase C-terminal domain-containing protein, partial [Planctomycetia bacterium]|nr:primase C-terminal domain-containing protein [Planctomycetia bacterium]